MAVETDELGHVFSGLGSQVTIVNRSETLLRHEDDDIRLRFTETTTAANLRAELGSLALRDLTVQDFGEQGREFLLRRGVDPDDVLVETRVNGEVRQHERTADLIFGSATIVSYVSRYVTLEAGDLIFTGTPGTTRALSDGDVADCEIECWLHGSCFDLRSGKPTGLPATEPVAVFPTEVRGDDVYVELRRRLTD